MLPVVQALISVAACVVMCWIAVAVILAVKERQGVNAGDSDADPQDRDPLDPCGPGMLHVATGPRLSRDVPTLPTGINTPSEPFPHPASETPLFFTL